jgi:uncharacterized Rmd1/YagE family protein
METAELKAVVVAKEINLNAIAAHFGIQKKFRWEDTLYLDSNQLQGILKDVEDKKVYIFYFGSVVFVNMAFHEMKDVLNYLKKLDKSIMLNQTFDIAEQYKIEVAEDKKYSISNELFRIPEDKYFYYEITNTVLAKSVAMERIEKSNLKNGFRTNYQQMLSDNNKDLK